MHINCILWTPRTGEGEFPLIWATGEASFLNLEGSSHHGRTVGFEIDLSPDTSTLAISGHRSKEVVLLSVKGLEWSLKQSRKKLAQGEDA